MLRRVFAGLALTVMLTGAPGLALADACHPVIDTSKTQYIVGYGSLMQQASKERTAPDAGPSRPVLVDGFQRAWNARGSLVGSSTTYLGVRPAGWARMVAAIYPNPDPEELRATDRREEFYCRESVPADAVQMLDGQPAPTGAEIWIYVNKPDSVFPPDARFPIVQSYVDIFVTGCMELAEKVRSNAIDFVEGCVRTTEGWSQNWVNDRLMPRRPFIHQPKSSDIDTLLQRLLPEQFAAIRIE